MDHAILSIVITYRFISDYICSYMIRFNMYLVVSVTGQCQTNLTFCQAFPKNYSCLCVLIQTLEQVYHKRRVICWAENANIQPSKIFHVCCIITMVASRMHTYMSKPVNMLGLRSHCHLWILSIWYVPAVCCCKTHTVYTGCYQGICYNCFLLHISKEAYAHA